MLYKILKLIKKTLLRTPLPACLFLGTAIGLLLYSIPKKRYTALHNAKAAYPHKPPWELCKIVRMSFINLGLSIIENFIAQRLAAFVVLKGIDNFDKNGGIIVGIHEGSWELYNYCLAKHINYSILVKPQKNEQLNRFINDCRKVSGIKVCFNIKELIRQLRRCSFTGLVIDHGAGNNALLIDFFSHKVPTPRGAVYMAKKFNKKIFPCFGYRINGFSHVLEIGCPIDPAGKEEEDLLTVLNKIYEDFLIRHPKEYVWYYKRFKHKRNRDVIILSDSKPGHIKQSQALLSFIKEKSYIIRPRTIHVEFRNQLMRIFAEICALFSGKSCSGCGWCLKIILKPDSYKELISVYADVVISTGSISAPVNAIFSFFLGAKSINILRPNTPLSKFNLTIIPEHDRIQSDHATTIKGALFYPSDLAKKSNDCIKQFKLSPSKKISFFLGGVLHGKQEFLSNLNYFIDNLKIFSQSRGYSLLLSTSRRTPAEAGKIIENELEKFPGTEAIVYANKNNYDFIFDGFVALSDIIFVSGESISMISEVASLKKTCVCVVLERYADKHFVFLDSLRDEVNLLEFPFDIEKAPMCISSIFETNKEIIGHAIEKIF
ncbi:MAG: ELM1/GtrOC1 family putative glycosyltransferase [Candidatus Omnitrophota bacterium]